MKRAALGTVRLRQCVVVGLVAIAVAAGAIVLSVKFGFCCIGPADALLEYVQMAEVAVTDLKGQPVAGVKVSSYVYAPFEAWQDSSEEEIALRGKKPELIRGVNHPTDASGRAVIPVFGAQIISVFPLIGPVPRKHHEKGMAGKVWIIAVDDGVNVDRIAVRMQPGSSGEGECWRVEIRALSTPQEYGLFDDHPLENCAK